MARKHRLHAVKQYQPPRVRKACWVAWCACGVGTPAKASRRLALEGLAVHTDSNGREYPT